MFPRLATLSISDSPSTTVDVVSVGPWEEPEFKLVCSDLPEATSWPSLESIQAALDYSTQAVTPPDLIVIAQPRPGYYRQEEIDRLQLELPLSRIVVVAGSWCEGELRTGEPLRGVFRLYWYEFAYWWSTALSALSEGLCPPWSMPTTNTRAIHLPGTPSQTWGSKVRRIAISADDPSVYQTLDSSLSLCGMSTSWVRPQTDLSDTERFRGAIWDGSQLGHLEFSRLECFVHQMQSHTCEVIALLDFPRAADVAQTRKAGVACVLGKPYVLADLVDALQRVARGHARSVF